MRPNDWYTSETQCSHPEPSGWNFNEWYQICITDSSSTNSLWNFRLDNQQWKPECRTWRFSVAHTFPQTIGKTYFMFMHSWSLLNFSCSLEAIFKLPERSSYCICWVARKSKFGRSRCSYASQRRCSCSRRCFSSSRRCSSTSFNRRCNVAVSSIVNWKSESADQFKFQECCCLPRQRQQCSCECTWPLPGAILILGAMTVVSGAQDIFPKTGDAFSGDRWLLKPRYLVPENALITVAGVPGTLAKSPPLCALYLLRWKRDIFCFRDC